MTDETGKKKLMREIEDLKQERDRARDARNEIELQRIEQEFDRLTDAARSISHPRACHNSETEKARKNVSNQITQIIDKLAKIPGLLPLSEHLENSIKKGEFLSYQGGLPWVVKRQQEK
jgi:hypothetical protein